MKTEIVTSFGLQGYRDYGKNFLTTFEKFLPEYITVRAYCEWASSEIHTNFYMFNLFDVPDFRSTLSALDTQLYRGREPTAAWKPKDIQDGYSFKFDAHKFFRKIFAIDHALQNTTADRLYWIDADVVAMLPLPMQLWADTLPVFADLSRLYRGVNYHSECGYIGIKVNDKTKKFYQQFKKLFTSGKFSTYKEWHDSYLFDRLIDDNIDLVVYNIPHTSKSQPFDNSAIGRYLIHLKGPRKIKGVHTQVEKEFYARR